MRQALASHLWTQETPAPWQYVELRLCREFHCLPSALRAERYADVMNILTMMGVEAMVDKQRRKIRK